ncbi:MAG: hypothetical protein PHS96_10975 [Anaerolineales bacterium]|nr:hypothetical protein [Anaerolineales bacterium]
MMRTTCGILFCLSLLLSACASPGLQGSRPLPESRSSAAASTPLPPTPAPSPTFTATPTPTPTRTPTPTPDIVSQLRQSLTEITSSEYWPAMNLSAERKAAWEAFAADEAPLSPAEQPLLTDFLSQWDEHTSRLADGVLPNDAQPALRLATLQDQGTERLVLYLIDEKSTQQSGAESLFLTIRPAASLPAYILAPQIPGLSQRISPDGRFVEYVDSSGAWVLKADARRLDPKVGSDSITNYLLDREYPAGLNTMQHVYPRFRFDIPNIESAFYAVDRLSLQQITLLHTTLEIFDHPELQGLKPLIFSPSDNTTSLVSRLPETLAAAQAIGYSDRPPRGVIVLYARNLFDNRYLTAASIAHEAAHIWQGVQPRCDKLDERRVNEIGHSTIPPGFEAWTPQELYLGITRQQIGAYHVSLWVLRKLGVDDWASAEERIILTGHFNGVSVYACAP